MRFWMAVALAATVLSAGCGQTEKHANLATGTASGNEQPGSSSHAEDAQFCASHDCTANFPNGNGTVVQCRDGKWSHSGGNVGACVDHGGEQGTEAESPARRSEPREENKQPEADAAWSVPHSGDASGDPLETLNRYWSDIRDHDFATAYSYLAPGAAGQSESEFVSGEQRAKISNAQFHGAVTSNSGSTTTVRVDSLMTEDAQFGCRSWSGTYTVTQESGEWRISHAAITPHGC